jgi:ABC-type uncharacterized transport system involved in gliding motility auxiliary subunit/ABC-type transport system involved in multi-copper enzyme maturation permease subunit
MRQIWTVARRDAKALFDQPTGYVLLVVFLAVNAFFFFRNAYLWNAATLRPMSDFLPWLFLFFVPAIAMRSLAEDHRSGLLEIVLAQPVSEAQLLLGKYLGVVAVVACALALTLAIPVGLAAGSHLPWGPVVAQYVGAVLLAAAFAAIGVWASSLSRSQITAFILAVTVMFVLILLGLNPLLVGLPPALSALAADLAVLPHFQSVGRGVLDLRDVLYFLSVAAIFLTLAYAVLMRRRLAPGSAGRRRLRLGTALLCAVFIAVDLAGSQVGGRLDLTPGHAYTLSPATRDLARSLPDLVTIRLYASRDLPSKFALTRRDVDDLLRDLKSAARGRIRVYDEDPGSSPGAEERAQQLGIAAVQFNVVGQSELQVKNGYFGLVVQYANKHETIPFIRQTQDLEYRLASAFEDLTRTEKPTLALITDPGAGSYDILHRQLEKSYQVETPDLADSATQLTHDSVLVIASARDTVAPAAAAKVRAFLAGGGKALILASGMIVPQRLPFARQRVVGWNPVLAPYGVRVKSDLVYDLRANQLVGVPSEFGQVFRPYPYFVRGQSTGDSPINAGLSEVDVEWGSSVDTTDSRTLAIRPLIVTTADAGLATGEAQLSPAQDWPTTDLGTRVLAVEVAPRGRARGARLVVAGDATLANDDTVQRNPSNLAFALNALDWLTQNEALITIRSKNRTPPPLVFSSGGLRAAVKYANLGVLPLLVAVFGVARIVKRRRLAGTPYRPEAASPDVAPPEASA